MKQEIILRHKDYAYANTVTLSNNVCAYDNDCSSVPYDEIRKVYAHMRYASTVRVMFGLLFATGCRIRELDNMKISNIQNNFLYWRVGKNQKGWRKVMLSSDYVKELYDYRYVHKVCTDKFFGVSSESFAKYFRNYKLVLGGGWIDKKIVPRGQGFGSYSTYTLAGLRKSYQALRAAHKIMELGDRGMAVSAVSKEMRHSSVKITEYYYLQDIKYLNSLAWVSHTPWTILYGDGVQHCLSEYLLGG